MKILLIALVVFFYVGSATSQALLVDSLPKVEQQLWKINFLLPGFEYERALGSFASVNINPYLDLGYSSNFVLGNAWLIQPSLDVQLRKYYNLLKRAAKDKRTQGNSANFVALDVFGVGRSIVDAENFRSVYYYGLGPIWGIQRTYRSKFNLSFNAGLAYVTNGFQQEDWLVRLNLRLGLALKRTR